MGKLGVKHEPADTALASSLAPTSLSNLRWCSLDLHRPLLLLLLLAPLPRDAARLLPTLELLAELLHAHDVHGVRRADPAARQDHQDRVALFSAPCLLRVARRALRGLRYLCAALPELYGVPRVEAGVREEPVGRCQW